MTDGEAAQPVRPGDRIVALDALRGFAMLGVLIAYCLWSLGTAPTEAYSRAGHAIDAALGFAVDGKMYTILAFLFGLGFSMQLGRARSDATAIRFYRRRLAALAAIGLVHALLLRNGDILFPYAVAGFLLIPVRRLSDRVLLVTAAVALLLPDLAAFLWRASGVPLPQRPDLANAPYLVENAAWVGYWLKLAPFTWPNNFALFLLGFLAGRHQLLNKPAWDRLTLAAIVLVGIFAGAFFYWLRLQLLESGEDTPIQQSLIRLSYTAHCWTLASAYAALLLMIAKTAAGPSALAPLGAIGRLALTNYLMQAALIVPLCLVFGWFDRFTPTTALLLAVGVFGLVQLPFSLLWLRRYQYGPVEWLWRLLTYGRAPSQKAATDYAPI